MARHGFELRTFPADELFIGRGGAHCMTCPAASCAEISPSQGNAPTRCTQAPLPSAPRARLRARHARGEYSGRKPAAKVSPRPSCPRPAPPRPRDTRDAAAPPRARLPSAPGHDQSSRWRGRALPARR
jgi:hypothetical protein